MAKSQEVLTTGKEARKELQFRKELAAINIMLDKLETRCHELEKGEDKWKLDSVLPPTDRCILPPNEP